MSYLLNLCYLVLLLAASPWLISASIRQGKYREGWAAKWLGRTPRRSGERPAVWLHAVSVGEVNLLQPLIGELQRRHPNWEIVISSTTKTGYDLARHKYSTLCVFYCPLDFSWAVRRALDGIRPSLLVLAELELWPNLIGEAKRRGVGVAVVNGRLSDSSARGYRRVLPFARWIMTKIDLIAAQNQEYAERFQQLGALPERVRVTGSLKFDGAETDRGNARTQALARLAKLDEQSLVFLAGSTQHPEEKMAFRAWQSLADDYPQLRLILVPRHPQRFEEVAQWLDQTGLPWDRRSQLGDRPSTHAPARILLVDAVGELGAWWGTAHIGFVGGSMGTRGGQNMIEPAAYGVATCFGPHTRNFRDVVRLLTDQQAAVVVRDGGELSGFLRQCLAKPEFAGQLGGRARQLVQQHLGATRRTLELLAPVFERSIIRQAGTGKLTVDRSGKGPPAPHANPQDTVVREREIRL